MYRGVNFSNKPSLIVLPLNEKVEWKKNERGNAITVSTDSLVVEINKTSAAISFFNKVLESAKTVRADFANAVVEGENVFHVKQRFILTNSCYAKRQKIIKFLSKKIRG